MHRSILVVGVALSFWSISVSAKDLSRLAVQVSGSIMDEDYPVSAVANREEGTTVVTFTIQPNGRVTYCKIAASSGSNALDLKTCEIVASRFVYDPARNKKGQPIEEIKTQRVHWQIPNEAPKLEPFNFEAVLTVEVDGRVSDCRAMLNGKPASDEMANNFCQGAKKAGFAELEDGKRRRVVLRRTAEVSVID